MLEQSENQLNLVRVVELFKRCIAHSLAEVLQLHTLRAHIRQYVLPIKKNVVEEFCHQQSGSLVFFTRLVQFLGQGAIIKLQLLIVVLSLAQLSLDLLQLLLEEVDHVFIILVVLRLGQLGYLLTFAVLSLLL